MTSQNPEVTYEALEKYGRDLVAEVRAGKIDPVIGGIVKFDVSFAFFHVKRKTTLF